MTDNNVTLLRYLVELRKRIINCLFVLVVIFFIILYFSNDFFTILAHPLLKYLPHGQGLIATNILSPFFVPFELTFFLALFLAVPVFFHQLWVFVAPALYHHERRIVWPLLFISTLLFYLGVAFAYFIVFPILFSFLIHVAPQGVQVSPDIAQYLGFTLKLFFVFGIIFEVPVITILLIWTGTVRREKLIQIRPYAIVAAFVIGMLLSPPDVISQTLLALPLWLLYELGILLAPLFVRRQNVNDPEKI